MKQTIQLKIGQQLTMTPQLQQAIRLLQLSSLELQAEIQEALDSNPMLELDEGHDDEMAAHREEQNHDADSGAGEELSREEGSLNDVSQDMPDDLPVDSAWEDVYDMGTALPSMSVGVADDREFERPDESVGGLQDELLWQIRHAHLSDVDMAIAEAIVDALDEDGYLTTSAEEIFNSLSREYEIDLDEVEAVLHRLQSLDPAGVCARDVRECMLLQLKRFPADTPWLRETCLLIEEYLDLLGKRDFATLKRRMRVKDAELQQIMALIHQLSPRPGNQLSSRSTEYVVPDVFVKKQSDKWRVELNSDVMPKIRINAMYADFAKGVKDNSDATFMKNNMQEARWFMKSIQSRNETLLRVATAIVEKQQEFLEQGEEAMKPMVLHDIAQQLEMHESTISRVTTKKYMHTPRGIFELKYFFSSHVSTDDGGEASATAIRAMIKKLIAAENPVKPLSDSKLASTLGEQGINVARRTVAKYREAMAIPPSHERKRLV